MTGSTISVPNPIRPLPEGKIRTRDEYPHDRIYYVGGTTEKSYAIAWQLLETLLDEPGGWRVEDWGGRPHHCASLVDGDVVCVKITNRVEEGVWIHRTRMEEHLGTCGMLADEPCTCERPWPLDLTRAYDQEDSSDGA